MLFAKRCYFPSNHDIILLLSPKGPSYARKLETISTVRIHKTIFSRSLKILTPRIRHQDNLPSHRTSISCFYYRPKSSKSRHPGARPISHSRRSRRPSFFRAKFPAHPAIAHQYIQRNRRRHRPSCQPTRQSSQLAAPRRLVTQYRPHGRSASAQILQWSRLGNLHHRHHPVSQFHSPSSSLYIVGPRRTQQKAFARHLSPSHPRVASPFSFVSACRLFWQQAIFSMQYIPPSQGLRAHHLVTKPTFYSSKILALLSKS